ncbi:hypothetical protein GCM10011503_26480 [Henriciella pelagia]|jgi:hypothetical protein|uniref:Uncharacterized protein n=2 Tax=Henriciella pelagia TaxID=1977912 RepID=A0ABQ1JSG0_9PROT|nr:hypothetical protein GCM10011503_26480 [Henriciella pelagia]
MVYGTVEEKLAASETIFLGAAEERSPTGEDETIEGIADEDAHKTRFRVIRSYRGPDAPTLEVAHRLSSAACGHEFRNGSPVLVFAYAGEDGALQTNSCALITYTRDEESVFDALEAEHDGKWWW